MHLNPSPWQTGALLSVIALVGHGSGAVNLDPLNPLLLTGCAHDPSQMLRLRSANPEPGQGPATRQLRIGSELQLTLSDGLVIEGTYQGKTPPPTMVRLATADGFFEYPASAITQMRYRAARNTANSIGKGAAFGAIPTAALGVVIGYNIAGSRLEDKLLGMVGIGALCAPFGAVPGAAAGGIHGLLKDAPVDVPVGGDGWQLD